MTENGFVSVDERGNEDCQQIIIDDMKCGNVILNGQRILVVCDVMHAVR